MIYILHGEDTAASYQRLRTLLASYPDNQKIRVTKDNTSEDFHLAAFAKDLFADRKIIICENILSEKKINLNILGRLPKEKIVFFWEHQKLPKPILDKFQNIAKIENFKQKSEIYWFLDSLGLNLQKSLALLHKLQLEDNGKFIPLLTMRLLQLLLVKHQIPLETAKKIIGGHLEDWQWQKVLTQSKLFELNTLLLLYNGVLKIDLMIKTGKTSVDPKTLTSFLLLKYIQK